MHPLQGRNNGKSGSPLNLGGKTWYVTQNAVRQRQTRLVTRKLCVQLDTKIAANWKPEGHQLPYVTQSTLFLDYALFVKEVWVAKPE